jgi:hydrogenase maturation protein HypF
MTQPMTQPIPADVALCGACRAELYDPADRRYRYPFINCTDCGPRYSVIEDLPYDRDRTTMRAFTMCAQCRAEYDAPASRRFHAEPIACPACGPRVFSARAGESFENEAAIAHARGILAGGGIVALKGLGGYHLACDARHDAAVERLRAWKERGDKPLAVMVRDRAALHRIARVSADELAVLESTVHPILLVDRSDDCDLARGVHPGVDQVGVMLPYTPLHLLLIDATSNVSTPPVLVMTSGNRASAPMIVDDGIALEAFASIADAVLTHDRPIATRVDDAVSQFVAGVEAPLRRARGHAPLPLRLPSESIPLLACGADLKNTICLANGRQAILSAHIGDLENFDVHREYEATIERLSSLAGIDPEVVCHDLHPGYWSRRVAEERFGDLHAIGVQHHHAHVAACMAEHALAGPVIGIAFDGTGYGEDGNLWGGEFLLADYATFVRAAHFAYVPMFGGERAILEPFRMALAYLRAADVAWDPRLAPVAAVTPAELRVLEAQASGAFPAPLTSSVGRLFDAVASLLGIRQRNTYNAQAAVELEAQTSPDLYAPYAFSIDTASPARIDVAPAIRQIVGELDHKTPRHEIGARFHETIVSIVLRVCLRLRREHGLATAVLSGGVFQNARLARDVVQALEAAGFKAYRHRQVPTNDGGVSFGQAVVGGARLAIA